MKTKLTKIIGTLIAGATFVWTVNAFISEETLAQGAERPIEVKQDRGLLSNTLNNMPVSSVLAGMAIEDAVREEVVDWDAAIALSDEMIELGREADKSSNQASSQTDTDIGRTIGKHLMKGSRIWTEMRLAKGKKIPSSITKQREEFEMRKKDLAKKHGEEWLVEAVAEADKVTNRAE